MHNCVYDNNCNIPRTDIFGTTRLCGNCSPVLDLDVGAQSPDGFETASHETHRRMQSISAPTDATQPSCLTYPEPYHLLSNF